MIKVVPQRTRESLHFIADAAKLIGSLYGGKLNPYPPVHNQILQK